MRGRTRNNYRAFRVRVLMLAAFFSLYSCIAALGNVYSRHSEFFPVFSWSLFSVASETVTRPELAVHRIGDRSFAPALAYTNLGDEFEVARRRSTEASKSARNLAIALEQSPERARALRVVLEERVFEGRSDIEYELRLVRFRPLDRWRDGDVIQSESLGRWTTGAQ